ncbi:hypothetical protein [Edaphovirga cremea]|uniref:hypothetical protein n=1 Tax=Edaphovirga cremea TaxID=2267246 RepID=UPI001300B3B5|nr:hypothetical protein [Edaphovirga cremea]
MSTVTCYSIYAVCGTCDHSLFVDYVDGSLYTHETDLLQQIERCSHQTLHAWQMQHHPQISEIFEIENVFSKEAAEEAVSFWKAYFSSLGKNVIDSTHVCEVFNGYQ